MDARLIDCFARLARSPENEPFRQWLGMERDRLRDILETLQEPPNIYHAQGGIHVVKKLQDLLAKAVDLRDKNPGA